MQNISNIDKIHVQIHIHGLNVVLGPFVCDSNSELFPDQ